VARLILDTGVLVAAARGLLNESELADDDDIALPAVAVAEYLAGVLLDADPARQAAQRAFLTDVLAVTPVCDYDRTVAEHHAALLAYVQQSGEPRSAHDLLIAATARATGRTVLSTDSRARFSKLPDVAARLIAT
jgi:tRNA(fMet)-specific endonuclease VapC